MWSTFFLPPRSSLFASVSWRLVQSWARLWPSLLYRRSSSMMLAWRISVPRTNDFMLLALFLAIWSPNSLSSRLLDYWNMLYDVSSASATTIGLAKLFGSASPNHFVTILSLQFCGTTLLQSGVLPSSLSISLTTSSTEQPVALLCKINMLW